MSISGNKSNIFSVSWPGTRRACSTRLKSRSFFFSPYRELELTSQLPPLFAYIPSGVVETRQAHLPEVEWNTRALLNACLKPFTRWSLGYSRAVLIELTSCLAKLVKWFIYQWTVCQRCAFLGEIRGKCYETTLLRKAVPAYLRRTVPNRSGSLWLTACHRNMNKVVQRINPNQDLYFKTRKWFAVRSRGSHERQGETWLNLRSLWDRFVGLSGGTSLAYVFSYEKKSRVHEASIWHQPSSFG